MDDLETRLARHRLDASLRELVRDVEVFPEGNNAGVSFVTNSVDSGDHTAGFVAADASADSADS